MNGWYETTGASSLPSLCLALISMNKRPGVGHVLFRGSCTWIYWREFVNEDRLTDGTHTVWKPNPVSAKMDGYARGKRSFDPILVKVQSDPKDHEKFEHELVKHAVRISNWATLHRNEMRPEPVSFTP